MVYNFDPENPHHWSFGNCPPGERFRCWHYEYLRDCPSAVQKVLKWREENPIEQSKPLEYFRGHPFERIIEEWPEMAWLEIPQEDRDQYLEVYKRLAEWSWQGFEEWLKRRPPAATFAISDLDDSDSKIIRELREFLKSERLRQARIITEKRGYIPPSDKVQSWLNGLGAWRLWRHGMTQESLLEHFDKYKKRRPYSHQSAVSKIVRQTAARLASMDQLYHE